LLEEEKNTRKSALKEKKELLDNFEKTMQIIEEYLSKSGREKGQKGLAMFVSKIEFVGDNPILDELGGVGGLLRFK
jgi:hypothetical protein